MPEEKYFQSQYINSDEATSTTKDDARNEAEHDVEIDKDKYGIAKPARRIIRGKIIND